MHPDERVAAISPNGEYPRACPERSRRIPFSETWECTHPRRSFRVEGRVQSLLIWRIAPFVVVRFGDQPLGMRIYPLSMREFEEFGHSRKLGGFTSRWLRFIPGIVGIIFALLTLGWPLWEKFGKVSQALSEVLFPGLLFVIAVAEHGDFTGHGSLPEFWGLVVAAAFNGILYCGLTLLALILWKASFQ
jgi:hypothetical protein